MSENKENTGLFWLASYPKSGNTWTRCFLANLQFADAAGVNINELHTGAIASSRPWVEDGLGIDIDELSHKEIEALRPHAYLWQANHKNDQYHKIHDAYTYLDDGSPLIPKAAIRGVVYLVRNPLDVVFSYANHSSIKIEKSLEMICDSQHGFCRSKRGLKNQLRQKLGSWSEHVLSWLEVDLPKLVMRYEDLKRDPVAAFTQIARFFEFNNSVQEIKLAVKKSRFEQLHKQEQEQGFCEKAPRVKFFFNKGKSGQWKHRLSPEQIRRVVEVNRVGMERLGYLDKRGRPLVRPSVMKIV